MKTEQKNGRTNVGLNERAFSLISGSALILNAIRRHSPKDILIGLLGTDLLYRGLTGHCHIYESLHINTAHKIADIKIRNALTIARTVEDVYNFWHTFENLPLFMEHIASVERIDNGIYRWTAKDLGLDKLNTQLSWDAQIIDEKPNQFIRWASLAGSDVENRGMVEFREAPGGRGTEIILHLEYRPPAGATGYIFSKVFNKVTTQQIKEDLRRFKQVMETGEVPTIEGQPSGAPDTIGENSREKQMAREDQQVTEAGFESFPTSDPPSWTAGKE